MHEQGEGMGSCLMHIELQFCKMGRILEVDHATIRL